MDAAGGRFVRQGVAAVVLIGLFGLLLGVTGSARLERADFVMNNGAEIATLDPAVVWWSSVGMYAVGFFVAFMLGPILMWLDG